MISLNYNTVLKMREAVGSIKSQSMVKVTNSMDWTTQVKVKDSDGNEEVVPVEKLMCFGWHKHGGGVFEVDMIEKQDRRELLIGKDHLTENVRGGNYHNELYSTCIYVSPENGYRVFDYGEPVELTDEEIIKVVENDIIYGVEPNLQSCSCVGTSAKGLDKDPNYRNGNYVLNDGKQYTVCWCHGEYEIRLGSDGGYYKGSNDVGRTIGKGVIDWKRWRKAVIMVDIDRMFTSSGKHMLSNNKDIIDTIYDRVKSRDCYKLNREFKEESESV